VAVQAILLEHDRMLATLDQYTWISKYIFPGGALPSRRAIEETVRDHTRLEVRSVEAFGADYARTLRAWRERFDAHVREVDALGFDATFRRMWDFYLAYCEAGFATGYLDVAQFVLTERGA
jgi:cyclopropane-fatty-acyl-phospholipid synthase